MSPTSVRRSARAGAFTLVELMVALSLGAIVCAGVLAAYLFVGRNLTRLVNFQSQEVESRRTLQYFTADASAAIAVTTGTATDFALSKPTSVGTTSVMYAYSAAAGTLTRTDGAGARVILTGLTSLTFSYYNEGGTEITNSPQSVKAVELSYASASGSAASGTRASYTTVSPRVVLRNKQTLQ
jgi:prepilin-type N-terminal cleavage/methylation domain-containing protein